MSQPSAVQMQQAPVSAADARNSANDFARSRDGRARVLALSSILILAGCARYVDDRAAAPALAPVTEPVTGSAASIPDPAKSRQPRRILGGWKQDDDIDPESGQRRTMFSNEALSTFLQFGAPVTASLYLYCDASSHQPKAAIYFSQEVGLDPAFPEDPALREVSLPQPSKGQSIRYRFDAELPTEPVPLQFRGHGQQADIAPELMAKILSASHVRMELELPWAEEDVSLEFDNKGAAEARSKLPC
jgi:hypothetical protein